jgi:hypothetical protein
MEVKNITAPELHAFLQGTALSSAAAHTHVAPVEDISSWLANASSDTQDAVVLQRIRLAQQAVSWAQGVHEHVRRLLSNIDLQLIRQIDQLARRKHNASKVPVPVQDAMFTTAPLASYCP